MAKYKDNSDTLQTSEENPSPQSEIRIKGLGQDFLVPRISTDMNELICSPMHFVRNNCKEKKFTTANGVIGETLRCVIVAHHIGFGFVPPFGSVSQLYKEFQDKAKQSGFKFNNNWFEFDEAFQVKGIKDLESVVLTSIDMRAENWVLLWLLPISGFNSQLPQRVLTFMPIKKGSIWGDNGFANLLRGVVNSRKAIHSIPMELSFVPTHKAYDGSEAYGVAFNIHPENPFTDEEFDESYFIDEYLNRRNIELELPDLVRQMVFHGEIDPNDIEKARLQEALFQSLVAQSSELQPSSNKLTPVTDRLLSPGTDR